MSAEENKMLTRRIFAEIVSGGDLALADQLVAEDFVDHNPPLPGLGQGRAGMRQLVGSLRAGFPDVQVVIEDMIAEGDEVAVRLRIRGTHEGPFAGVPATGRQVEWTAMQILRFANGKNVERWAQIDFMSLMQQLGVIPAPGQAPAPPGN
jgi:steroid delta-isomerase-like uncharacterized protein